MQFLLFLLCLAGLSAAAQLLNQKPSGLQLRLSSFENKNSISGSTGKTNKVVKGNAFERIYPGETKPQLDIKAHGEGIFLVFMKSL